MSITCRARLGTASKVLLTMPIHAFFRLDRDEDAAQRLGQACELNVSTVSRMVSYWPMLFHPVIAVFNAQSSVYWRSGFCLSSLQHLPRVSASVRVPKRDCLDLAISDYILFNRQASTAARGAWIAVLSGQVLAQRYRQCLVRLMQVSIDGSANGNHS